MEEEISRCECPPGGETYVNEDGMTICVSCGGWEVQQHNLVRDRNCILVSLL